MSKIRTLSDLQDRLDHDFAWRLKELDSLKKIVQTSEAVAQKTAIRSAVCLAYAHWEGFVKQAAEAYIEFVSNRRLRFDELSDCFVLIGAKRKLKELASEGGLESQLGAVQFFRNDLSERAYLRLPGHVKTRSNLNSEVFSDIALTIGAETEKFSTRFNQIDEELLSRRNSIAHGEYLSLEKESCRGLVDDVIQLIRTFKNEIERLSSDGAYRLTEQA